MDADEKRAAVERTRMALAEAGYPNAEVDWSDALLGPAVTTWRETTGPLVPADIAARACDLAMAGSSGRAPSEEKP